MNNGTKRKDERCGTRWKVLHGFFFGRFSKVSEVFFWQNPWFFVQRVSKVEELRYVPRFVFIDNSWYFWLSKFIETMSDSHRLDMTSFVKPENALKRAEELLEVSG